MSIKREYEKRFNACIDNLTHSTEFDACEQLEKTFPEILQATVVDYSYNGTPIIKVNVDELPEYIYLDFCPC